METVRRTTLCAMNDSISLALALGMAGLFFAWLSGALDFIFGVDERSDDADQRTRSR